MRFPSVLLLGVVCSIAPILPMSAADVGSSQIQTDTDPQQKLKTMREDAAKGVAAAQYGLGVFYSKGDVVQQDSAIAVGWFRRAASQGFVFAEFSLGVCYETGKGVERSDAEAVKWYRKAADHGYWDAQHNLGVLYYEGRGASRDYGEAVKWFRRAAEQGQHDARHNLGVCYENGDGVEKDYVEAYAWYNLAGKEDSKAATNRDLLEKRMTPQQIADAQKRTKELRKMIEEQMAGGKK